MKTNLLKIRDFMTLSISQEEIAVLCDVMNYQMEINVQTAKIMRSSDIQTNGTSSDRFFQHVSDLTLLESKGFLITYLKFSIQ